jgi:hypothetical protein
MKLLGWKKGTLQAMPGSSAAAAEELQGCDLGQFTQEYVYRKSYPFYLYIYTYMFVCVCAYVYTYIYMCMSVRVYVYTYTGKNLCRYVYMIYVYLHGHTRIFALGIFVDLGIPPCSNFATLTALCALCENESNVSLWF